MTKKETKELDYLKEKEKICPLDKNELFRIIELSSKENNNE